jgi:hypothetical protein
MTTALAISPAAVPASVYQQPAPSTKRQRAKPTLLTADEAPARKAKASRLSKSAAPTPLVQEAARLGFPTSLFGFTPEQIEYWTEPGLPWLTKEMITDIDKMPLDYRGRRAILCIGHVDGNHMGPRFPKGCGVQTAPVGDKANLIVGRVYTYRYWNEEAKEWAYEMGRLVKIGGNYLEVKADNHPIPSLWLLREVKHEAVWDVREVTHYASYPDLDTLPTAG